MSVFGPMLFLVYINDLTFQVQSSEVRLNLLMIPFCMSSTTILWAHGMMTSKGLHPRLGTGLSNLVHLRQKPLLISKTKYTDALPHVMMNGTAVEERNSCMHFDILN